MTVRLGLIGLGGINMVHVMGYQASKESATIVAACDVREDIVKKKAGQLGCRPYTDYRELLEDSAVDAVDITLPHNLHFEVALAALQHGKHVVIEKPMATTVAECDTLLREAHERGLVFTVAENTRFVTAYMRVKDILDQGEIGNIRLIRTLIFGSEVARLNNTSLWKGRKDGTVGGVIMDAGPHSFYLLKWLNGPVRSLRAVQHKLVQASEVEDFANVTGVFENGALFSSEYTFTAEIPWGERLEVYGSKGTILVDQLQNPPAKVYHGGGDFEGTPITDVAYEPFRWKLQSIMDGVQDFVLAVDGRRPTAVSPADGGYAIRMIERAYESVRQGGVEVVV